MKARCLLLRFAFVLTCWKNSEAVLSKPVDGESCTRNHGTISVVREVERITWNRTHKFSQIADSRLPFVVVGSPVSKWTAVQRWDPDYLIQRLGKDARLYVTSSRDGNFLYYSEAKSKRSFEEYVPKNYEGFMPLINFVRILKRNETQRARKLYYKIHVDQNNPFRKVMDDLNTKELLCIPDCSQTTIHLWFGPGGVRSEPHFDISQNFYVQIFGEKTFYLAPPNSTKFYRMFPDSHPSKRHSALKMWPQVDYNIFPESTQIGLWRAVLKPGDVLHIPSLWMHSTQSLEKPNFGFSFWNFAKSVPFHDVISNEGRDVCLKSVKATPFHKYKLWEAISFTLYAVYKKFGDQRNAQEKLLSFLDRFNHESCGRKSSNYKLEGRTQMENTHSSSAFVPSTTWMNMGSSSSRHLRCLKDTQSRFEKAFEKLETDFGPIGVHDSFYGGEERFVEPFVEALAEKVLSVQKSCHFFDEVRAYVKAQMRQAVTYDQEEKDEGQLLGNDFALSRLQWKSNSCWLDAVMVSLLFHKSNPFFRHFRRGIEFFGDAIQSLLSSKENKPVNLVDDMDLYLDLCKERTKENCDRIFVKGTWNEPYIFLRVLMSTDKQFDEQTLHVFEDPKAELAEYVRNRRPPSFIVLQNFQPMHTNEKNRQRSADAAIKLIATGFNVGHKHYSYHAGYAFQFERHWTAIIRSRGKNLEEIDALAKTVTGRRKPFRLSSMHEHTVINTAVFVRDDG